MSTIPLNSDGGLEPHICICPRCKEDNGELTIGVLRKAQASDGLWVYCSRGQSHKVNRERMNAGLDTLSTWEPVKEGEKVPGDLCEKCQTEIDRLRKIVSEGGIYFICDQCNCEGVIRKNELTEHVREQLKVEAPAACGIRFEHCKEHDSE